MIAVQLVLGNCLKGRNIKVMYVSIASIVAVSENPSLFLSRLHSPHLSPRKTTPKSAKACLETSVVIYYSELQILESCIKFLGIIF